jgi:hypothetical protein
VAGQRCRLSGVGKPWHHRPIGYNIQPHANYLLPNTLTELKMDNSPAYHIQDRPRVGVAAILWNSNVSQSHFEPGLDLAVVKMLSCLSNGGAGENKGQPFLDKKTGLFACHWTLAGLHAITTSTKRVVKQHPRHCSTARYICIH